MWMDDYVYPIQGEQDGISQQDYAMIHFVAAQLANPNNVNQTHEMMIQEALEMTDKMRAMA